MKPSLLKIYNIFKLEAENNFDNRAVIGGLDRIIDNWEAEARDDGLPEQLIHVIGSNLRNYPHIATNSRAEVLDGLWRRVQKETGLTAGIEFKRAPTPLKPSTPERPETRPVTTPETGSETVTDIRHDHPDLSVEIRKEPAALDAQVTVLPGVGQKYASTLKRLRIESLRDMLYYFPRRYDDYTQLKPINRLKYGDEVTIIGTLQTISQRRVREGKSQIIEGILSDGTGAIRLTWFNQPWIIKRLHTGTPYAVSGKIDQYLGRLTLNNPEPEQLDQQLLSSKRIVPVYRLTEQITQRWIRKILNQVVTYWAPRIVDPLPEKIRKTADLLDLSTALLQAHFPDSWERLQAAQNRLAFDEIFLLQLGVQKQRRIWQARTAKTFEISEEWFNNLLKNLPYPLTNSQLRAFTDARRDLSSGRPMNRLLEGDVGSGKTIVAALVIAMVTHQGAQATLMAPTSILAEQHYRNLKATLTYRELTVRPPTDNIPIDPISPASSLQEAVLREDEIHLLVGSTPESEKEKIRQGLENGTIKLVIGTHALIEKPINFADLELIIIDEQHRFGVEQRAALRSKGKNPHLLVMTATPIPRSLALTLYGDLDLSILDEMPPGRKPINTYLLAPMDHERAYNLIRKQVDMGFQAFIVYPLIEDSESNESMSAVDEHNRLQSEIFPNYKIGLLHGRLKPDEKEEVMRRFRDRDYQILVSTTVIEVGVDIPNANVMLIEGANRYGLAQLHQLRGRVGRGAETSFCLLIPDRADTLENERLQAMATTNDGFTLAEKDLAQRGPGEFLGTRQSGYAKFHFANIMDAHLIEKAHQQVQTLLDQDSELQQPENQLLAQELAQFWNNIKGDVS